MSSFADARAAGWLGALPAGVVVVGPDDTVLFVNAAWAALYDVASDAATGRPLGDVVDEPARTALPTLIAHARSGEAAGGVLAIGIGDAAREVRVEFVAVNAGDGVPNVVGTFIALPADARPVVAGPSLLQLPNDAVARARERFVTLVSHELRSPLNAIQSWSHVLESQLDEAGDVASGARRALAGIRAGVEQQVALIEQLCEATVALIGPLHMSLVSMSVRAAIEFALAEVRESANTKDVVIHVDMRLDDACIHGDVERIQKVFVILLSNAFWVTPQGGDVWLSARRDRGEATVVVRDGGSGLAPGHESRPFEPFLQADGPDARRSGGVDLELAYAQRIVAAHAGRLDARSGGLHPGTTFTVSLPLERRASVKTS